MNEQKTIINQFEDTRKTQRPVAITVVCIIGFIGALISVPMIFSQAAVAVGSWYPPYLGFAVVAGLICMIGLWLMKKWAAYLYTGLVLLNQIVLLAMGVWNIMALIIPAIVVGIALYHVKKMN